MTWLIVAVAIVASYVAVGSVLQRRHLRVVATVDVPERAPPTVVIEPPTASQEDLIRLCLVYGSKLRWISLREPQEIQEILAQLAAEAVDAWLEGEGRLLMRMPTAKQVLASHQGSMAVPGGERFVVKYSRTSYENLKNKSSLTNTIPRPGMAVNLAWNFAVLLDAVHSLLDEHHKQIASEALSRWWGVAFSGDAADPSLAGFARLVLASDAAWEEPLEAA